MSQETRNEIGQTVEKTSSSSFMIKHKQIRRNGLNCAVALHRTAPHVHLDKVRTGAVSIATEFISVSTSLFAFFPFVVNKLS